MRNLPPTIDLYTRLRRRHVIDNWTERVRLTLQLTPMHSRYNTGCDILVERRILPLQSGSTTVLTTSRTTTMTQAGVTSLFLILLIFCSASWARPQQRSQHDCYQYIFNSVLQRILSCSQWKSCVVISITWVLRMPVARGEVWWVRLNPLPSIGT